MAVLKKKKFLRGVVVDMLGNVVSEITWLEKDGLPNVNITVRNAAGAVTENIRRVIIEDLAEYRNPTQRWNHKKKVWLEAPLKLYVVSERTGALLRTFSTWPDMIPDLPDGFALVDDAPPPTTSRKPIYNFTTEAWEYPRRVAVLDDTSTVVDIVLENPDDSKPNYEPVEKNWKCVRADKRGRMPKDDDGNEITIGHVLEGKKWKRKEKREGE